MLLAVYLEYLHIEFEIQRLTEKRTGLENSEVLNVSARLFSTVMVLTKQRDNTVDCHRDFAWSVSYSLLPSPSLLMTEKVLFYGLPSALVLTGIVLRNSRSGQPFPAAVSRAVLIRNLSVFISCLEWVARPGDGNYGLCEKAGKVLTQALDEALETSTSSTSSGRQSQQPMPDYMAFDSPFGAPSGVPSVDSSDFRDWFDLADTSWQLNPRQDKWAF
jgi:hypothetical protein